MLYFKEKWTKFIMIHSKCIYWSDILFPEIFNGLSFSSGNLIDNFSFYVLQLAGRSGALALWIVGWSS